MDNNVTVGGVQDQFGNMQQSQGNYNGGMDNKIGLVGSSYLNGGANEDGYPNLDEENWDAESAQSEPDNFNDCEERNEHIFDNGAKYKGQWKGNVRHGYGVQIWPDGARYEGYWKNNKAHGQGTFWHVYGDKYEGAWKRDKAHGRGKYTHSNGATYEGEWKNDLQHGEGVEFWNDNSKYEGQY
jgi:hypothetical protein